MAEEDEPMVTEEDETAGMIYVAKQQRRPTRFNLKNKDGEISLQFFVVIEDYRIAFYVITLLILLTGLILTKLFTKEDYEAIIRDVYGDINVCVYVDFAPSTYVTPAMWCFGVATGFIYSVTSILRVIIAYRQDKLSRAVAWLEVIMFAYVIFSIFFFSLTFSVQPVREKPESMVVHTIGYLNWQVMYGVLQVAVCWFGVQVSWVGVLPQWFHKGSIIHAYLLIASKIVAVVWIINALGDMGERLEGKGKWWSVKSRVSIWVGKIFVNALGMILGMILPLLQAIYISWRGVRSHTLSVEIADNRKANKDQVKLQMEQK